MDETIAIDAIDDFPEPESPVQTHAKATMTAAKLGCLASILGALIAVFGPALLDRYGGPFFRRGSKKRNRPNKSLVFEVSALDALQDLGLPQNGQIEGKHDFLPANQVIWFFASQSREADSAGVLSGPIKLFRNGTWSHRLSVPKDSRNKIFVQAIIVSKSKSSDLMALSSQPCRLDSELKRRKVKFELVTEFEISSS